MGNPPFADIHCHPEFKSFLTGNECWHNLVLWKYLKIVDKILLGGILESQSTLMQLDNSRGNIALVGLYVTEKAMIKGSLINILGVRVNVIKVAGIMKLLTPPRYDKIDYDLVKRIASARARYFSLFKEVQAHMLASETIDPGYNLLRRMNEYDVNRLNLIFTIEGGHNLLNKRCGCALKRNVLNNFKDLKSSCCRYFFMSITHMERNRLCTNAYGIKFIRHRMFKPVGYGITSLGKNVIREALRKPNRILIDIKHMSLEARKQYYEILKREYASEKIPIVVSHGGVTGVSYERMPVVKCKRCCRWTKVRYYKPNGLDNTKFNPWSINLYDEEIEEIVRSEGLIGLELDARILGARQKKPAELIEYFSRRELSCRKLREQHAINSDLQEPDVELSEREKLIEEIQKKLKVFLREIIRRPDLFQELLNLFEKESRVARNERMLNIFLHKISRRTARLKELQKKYDELKSLYNKLMSMPVILTDNDIKHLCNNILHIVKIGGERAWKCICIGSDFDGLIDSLDGCDNATEFKKLAKALARLLPRMAATNPGLHPITHINQKVDDIMFKNVYDFLSKHFT